MLWRPITRGVATLNEIRSSWTIKDLADANEALDIIDESEMFEQEKINAELKRGK